MTCLKGLRLYQAPDPKLAALCSQRGILSLLWRFDTGRGHGGVSNSVNLGDDNEVNPTQSMRLQRRPDLETRIHGEQVRLLYDLGATSRLTMFVAIIVVGLTYLPFAPLWTLLPVLAVQGVAQLMFDHLRRLSTADERFAERADLWGRRYAAVTLISGTTWSLGAYYWLPQASFDYQIFYVLVLACLSIATAVTRATYPLAVVAYVTACCGPTMLWMIFGSQILGLPIAVMGAIFIFSAYGLTRQINRSYREAMRLRFQNADMAEGMMRAQSANAQKRHDAEIAEQRARSAARAKDEFLTLMSFEIGTPLEALDGQISRLVNEGGDHQAEIVRDMRETLEYMRRLIGDVVDFTQLEAHALDLKLAPFDPASLVRGIVRMMRHKAEAKNLSLELDLSADTPALMVGDADRVRQLLVNLVSNSIAMTPRGGIILRLAPATGQKNAGMMRFSVSDTGKGLSNDDLVRTFSSHQVGERKLSLTICDMLVRRMGGHIGVDSSIGLGSRFWFLLPILPERQAYSDEREPLIDHAHLFELEREVGSDRITNRLVGGLEKVLELHRKVEKARVQRNGEMLAEHIGALQKAATDIGLCAIARVAAEIDQAILQGDSEIALKDVPRIQQKITASWRELAKAYPGLGA